MTWITRRITFPATLAAATVMLAALAVPAQATFPGVNGSLTITTDLYYFYYPYQPHNIDILKLNSGRPHTDLTDGSPAYDAGPSWSPDGSKFAFDTLRDGQFEVYTANADGSGVTRLTNNPALDGNAAWSGDGKRIAFNSTRDGNYEIYSMNTDGSDVRRLTYNSAADLYPAWSPDNKKIAFESTRDGNYEIYSMNADGTAVTRLTKNAGLDLNPNWSPDGKMIAFRSQRFGRDDVFAMYADGRLWGDLTYGFNGPGPDDQPVWSPDGRSIAFVNSGKVYSSDHNWSSTGKGWGTDRYPYCLSGIVYSNCVEVGRDGSWPDWQPLQTNEPPATGGPGAPSVQQSDLANAVKSLKRLGIRHFYMRNRLMVSLHAQAAGTVSGELSTVVHTGSAARKLVLAKGSHRFKFPGQANVELRVTKAGHSRLRQAGRLKVTLALTFSPPLGTVTGRATKVVTLTR